MSPHLGLNPPFLLSQITGIPGNIRNAVAEFAAACVYPLHDTKKWDFFQKLLLLVTKGITTV